MIRRFTLTALFLALLASCRSTTPAAPATTPATAASTPSQPLFGPHGFDLAALDRNAAPCDDFYQFAVGKWREAHPLPETYSRFGRFEELAERNRQTLRAILEEDAANTSAPHGSAAQKVGDYYAACMNEQGIEAAGLTPIEPDLQLIDSIRDRASLVDAITRLQQRGYSPLFRLSAQADYHNSQMIIAALSQGGLSLPDREYYLSDQERFRTIRTQFVDHITRMLTMTGESQAQAAADAQRVLALETSLAKASMTRVEQRNPDAVYHITSLSELNAMTPAIDWTAYLRNVGLNVQSVNVAQPNFLREANRVVADLPVEDWKAYLRWNVLRTAAPTLPARFAEEAFNFTGRTLSGQKQQRPRWERCVLSADQAIGQLLGQEYVRRAFTPEAKKKANELIDNLVTALREDIPTLPWMGSQTKQAAIEKLNAFARRIGYPDKWRDYSALSLSRDSFNRNVMAAQQFNFQRTVNRIGRPDDPNEWLGFTPPTVNASYNPSRNDITFPAGILQPPFYDPNADDAYNYGGIGTVIGHEMTHGFDDEGSRFDAQGNLRNWWTPEDLKNFQGRAECIANEYSEFAVSPGVYTQGKLVTGEAIADLGGATIALAAYERSLRGKERKVIDGFTPEQRFFLGFAQVWGENMAPQEAQRRVLTDPHAQGPFRVNGTVQNMPAFQKAFGCANGTKMVREEGKRCAIW